MTRAGVRSLVGAGVLGVGLLLLSATAAPEVLHVGHFSMTPADSNGHPIRWRPITFSNVDKKTRYKLVQRAAEDDTMTVVRAVSNAGASALVRERRIDPQEYPILSWRWKVTRTLDAGDATEKDGDDYPARIYVSFDYDPSKLGFFDQLKYRTLKTLGYDQIPTRALNYIWANRVPKDTVLPNPYTDWVQMIAVESGSPRIGQWVPERRNLRADYRQAFGESPPPISGIAIMTDTDDTGESATAYFGNIVAHTASPSSPDSLHGTSFETNSRTNTSSSSPERDPQN